MSEPKTPNLGLNKIDRSSPSTTYFDLDKYLDQNWEKVDGFAEQVEEKVEETAGQVSSIQERLDTEKRRSVTLEPGLQIINAERTSAFKLEGLKGRTLVNLLGRAGGMESLTGIASSRVTTLLDTANKTSGSSGLKVTNGSSASSASAGIAYVPKLDLKAGSYYVLIAEAKNGNAVDGLQIGFGDGFAGPYSPAVKATDKFTTVWTKKQLSSVTSGNMDMAVVGPESQYGYFDDLRLYEISATEYAALDNMTPEQVNAKYPYVDSVQPVRNPYAIRYGENLLPPFFDNWRDTAGTTKVLNSPYDITINNPNNGDDVQYYFNCFEGDVFTLSVEHTGRIGVNAWDINDNTIGTDSLVPYTANQSATFTIPAGTVKASIHFGNVASEGQYLATCSFKNPMLVLGTTAKPFKPREDAMLALQTDLFADPITGTNADEVFERGGQYFRLAKWRGLTLDGSLSWVVGDTTSTGLRQVKVVGLVSGAVSASGWATKYDGKIIPQGTTGSTADTNAVTGAGDFYISVPVADSGWGDNYTPSADEIKAYFMGWVMFNGSAGTGVGNSPDVPTNNVYNGTGTKWWARRSDGVARTWADATNTLPTTQAPNGTPYQLVYQLATPTVEPITSEGQLTLSEGNNQVEVGTGIVLREYAPVPANSNPNLAGRREINFTQVPASLLKNKARSILAIYKNGVQDHKWAISDNAVESYGTSRANIPGAMFDPSATYSVTYFMLDKTPIAPFIGSVPDNEKALLTDLVQDFQQANTRLSVVESKKVEKDTPAWIAPTLLSGSTNFDTVQFTSAGYYKDSQGLVHIRGLLRMAAVDVGTPLFILPLGYRPARRITLSTIGGNGSGGFVFVRLDILPNGTVQMTQGATTNDMLSLDDLPLFQAKQ